MRSIVILCISIFPLFSSALEIQSPKTGIYAPGKSFSFNWNNSDFKNRDQYRYRWTFVGTKVDNNGTVNPTEVTETSGWKENNESCPCGNPSTSGGEFTIPCNWYSGTIIFEVEAREQVPCNVFSRCWEVKETATPTVVTIVPQVEITPEPQTLLNCTPNAPFTVTSKCPIQGYTTYWYNSNNQQIFIGDTYTQVYAANTGTQLSVQWKKDSYVCGYTLGIKSPILVLTVDLSQNIKTVTLPEVELSPAGDLEATGVDECGVLAAPRTSSTSPPVKGSHYIYQNHQY